MRPGERPCEVCRGPCVLFDRAIVMGRYEARYLQCTSCGLVAVHRPDWLAEAYAEPINATDVGLVSRCTQMATLAQAILGTLFRAGRRFLDFGGGYGLFVRLMRDAGYDFYRYDPHCENLFAKGRDLRDAGPGRFDLVTAFEVFEHVESPTRALEEMLGHSDHLLFSTLLLPTPTPRPTEWWYYGLEHGQHISLFTHKALHALARRHGLFLYSARSSIHLLTKRRIPGWAFSALSSGKVARLAASLTRRPSLTQSDYEEALRSAQCAERGP